MHLVHGRVSSLPSTPADGEPAVLALARQAVLEHHHRGDRLGALVVRDVVALDPQRCLGQVERLLQLLERLAAGGQVAGPLQLVQGQRLLGVAATRSPSAPACRRAAAPAGRRREPRSTASQAATSSASGGSSGTSTSRGTASPRLAAVHLLQEVLDQVGGRQVLDLLDDPAALAADPAAADVEHLDRGLELVLGEREHVGVGARRRGRRRSSPAPARARRCRRAAGPPARSPARPRRPVISRSSRRTNRSVLPAMKSQKSSASARCSSGLTRPTHGAEHLPM